MQGRVTCGTTRSLLLLLSCPAALIASPSTGVTETSHKFQVKFSSAAAEPARAHGVRALPPSAQNKIFLPAKYRANNEESCRLGEIPPQNSKAPRSRTDCLLWSSLPNPGGSNFPSLLGFRILGGQEEQAPLLLRPLIRARRNLVPRAPCPFCRQREGRGEIKPCSAVGGPEGATSAEKGLAGSVWKGKGCEKPTACGMSSAGGKVRGPKNDSRASPNPKSNSRASPSPKN